MIYTCDNCRFTFSMYRKEVRPRKARVLRSKTTDVQVKLKAVQIAEKLMLYAKQRTKKRPIIKNTAMNTV